MLEPREEKAGYLIFICDALLATILRQDFKKK